MIARVRLGTLAPMNDRELDDFLTEITPQEIARFRALWQKYAAPKYADLIDAKLIGVMDLSDIASVEIVEQPSPSLSDLPDIMVPEMIMMPSPRGEPAVRVPLAFPEMAINMHRFLSRNQSPFDSRYKFNPAMRGTGRYIDQNGNPVDEQIVDQQLDIVIRGIGEEMVLATDRLSEGEIGIQDWYNTNTEKMKMVHSVAASIEKGGWGQMGKDDWADVGAISKKEYVFYNNLSSEVIRGDQPLTGRRLRFRVRMYALAARSTGNEFARNKMESLGVTHERRRLGVADHCSTAGDLEGCLQLAARRWEPIGLLPAIGMSPCRNNCRCKFLFGIMENGRVVQVI